MSEKTAYSKGSGQGGSSESEKRPCLVMIRGDFIGQVYEINDGVTTIGRSDDADLVVSDTSISRNHAIIEQQQAAFFLSDNGSTNGSYVNKALVDEPMPLKEGDKVGIGDVVFKFTYQDDDDTQYHMMLRNMAIRDGLTRIYNKRHFTEVLEKEIEYNKRTKEGLCLILFDIDHFKQINDTWGHPAGDFILKNLAHLIDSELRGYDLFARYGGEEFAFLLRGSSLEEAVGLAERVRTEVAEHVFTYEDVDLNVTISLGVYFWDGKVELDETALVDAADRLLYKAKDEGRNRVCA